MTFRPGPLRAAALLAAGFVAARVVYRILFHGADGDGFVLLDLPAVRLPAPFAHVVLLGPVTIDGLWDAAASALPIALAILAFGVLNAVVDLNRVFARASRRGPLRGIARALAIAGATLPALADGARAVRFAQRLRGERGGPRMLLPLLERTLERAGNVAAALELRGFAGRGLDGDCLAPVEARDVEIGFGRVTRSGRGRRASAADVVSRPEAPRSASAMADAASPGIRLPADLVLSAGTLTLVSGATGSGKSTLLRAIAGLHTHTDGGWIAGSLRVVGHERDRVPPRDLAQRVGVVLQHPREAFATELVRDEIGLALELRGVAPVIVGARVAEVAARVGVTGLLDRPTRGLSAGEATLVAIAAATIEHPILLLVDEPLADLDADARVRIAGLLDALAHEAVMCVVVAEHRVATLSEITDTVLRIDGGVVSMSSAAGLHPGSGRTRVVRAGSVASPAWAMRATPQEDPAAGPDSDCGGRAPGHGGRAPGHGGRAPGHGGRAPGHGGRAPGHGGRAPGDGGRAPALSARGITVRHGAVIAVDSADLTLDAGEIVALVGPNGAGKSSLLAALAVPERGAQIEAAGRVALIPDASDDLFVFDTVGAECARADRRATRSRREPGRRRGPEPASVDLPSSHRHVRSGRHTIGDTADRFAGFLGRDPEDPAFAALLARHPRDLSVGERRCLALAIQVAGEPAVLLVDEPTRGLDPAARDVLWAALLSLAEAGAAIAVGSHEPEVAARADRVLSMRAGVLDADPPRRPPATAPYRSQDHRPGPAHETGLAGFPGTGVPEYGTQSAAHQAAGRVSARLPLIALLAANLVALGAFCWPLVATAVPQQAYAAVPIAALALAPLAMLVVVSTLDGTVRSAHMLALLGTLAAIGAAVRIAGTGVGGVEAVFILLVLAGRAYGARFGMLLGMATIALSTVITGTFGPWTPFQMFACAWVGAVAGLLPRRSARPLHAPLPRRLAPTAEIAMLCVYGVVASYVFGLLMNLWFWPFAVGYGTGISYDGTAPLEVNLSSFLLYSLVTSTLSWDTLRAITTVVGLIVVGRPILAALRRAKPLAPHRQHAPAPRERASALS
ncbi:ATP-binding cassette domain-containing protein [Microbacterium sp. LWS13-1.2]|uniref:ATP-binding cassette domain-containing protein n=1 Tax=Microbacterium sp. LWS13-1.2 TaxID=3135264 RepID=A0AAU6SAV6_9MICO